MVTLLSSIKIFPSPYHYLYHRANHLAHTISPSSILGYDFVGYHNPNLTVIIGSCIMVYSSTGYIKNEHSNIFKKNESSNFLSNIQVFVALINLPPSSSLTRSVLACITVSLWPIIVNKYSPSPLNVYESPSVVIMWGSPQNQPDGENKLT